MLHRKVLMILRNSQTKNKTSLLLRWLPQFQTCISAWVSLECLRAFLPDFLAFGESFFEFVVVPRICTSFLKYLYKEPFKRFYVLAHYFRNFSCRPGY